MATRATYRFLEDNATFYLHWDGYPEGAALHFAKAIDYEAGDTELLELTAIRFLLANRAATVIDAHDSHADTEYRYDIGLGHVVVMHRVPNGSRDYWERLDMLTVQEFLEKYPVLIERESHCESH